MNRRLVMVHGRSQQRKDAVALKAEWITAFREGLGRSNLTLPIPEEGIRFPYYGDTLYDLAKGSEQAAEVIVRGNTATQAQKEFIRSVLEEVRRASAITEEQLAEVAGKEVVEKGPQNWEWVQAILRVIDKHVPGGSGASIALATNDVYQYLRNPGIRDVIEKGVRNAISPGISTVVVSHSLGTVVSYNLLRREGVSLGWTVPLYVTLGSPLAVTAIKQSLRPISHPECAGKWYNAMDERDVVALYPLDNAHFDVEPTIENNTSVRNVTENRHGISGYLNDRNVARLIYDALMA